MSLGAALLAPTRLIDRALQPVDPGLYTRSAGDAAADLQLRYLGTAGFELKAAGRTVVIDPFITRPDLPTTATQPLVPDREALARVLPEADEVLIGHAHHDHVLDGPALCHLTGARFIGSPSACNVARAASLPERQIVETRGREDIALGEAGRCRGIPSRHGRVYFGRVSLPGDIPAPPPWPPRFSDLRHGLVLNWYVEMAGVRVVHVDSADFIDAELDGLQADVVCLCAIGRAWRPGYVATAVRKLRPRVIVACHWDWFFTPYGAPPRLLPGVDLPGFIDEIEGHGVEAVVLPFDGAYGVRSVQAAAAR